MANSIGDQAQDWRYVHLKEISVDFIKRRPKSDLELVFKDDTSVQHKSIKFKKGDLVLWNFDMYVRAHSSAKLTIRRLGALFKRSIAEILVEFKLNEFVDGSAVGLEDSNHRVTVNLVCGRSESLKDVARVLGFPAVTPWIDLASMVPRFLKLPQLAALPMLTSERGYDVPFPAILWLNDDILLGIFNCYRLDDEYHWNYRLGWCRLSHVCQRWRHLIYECACHLGMHIECTNGVPIVDTLDHLPPLPLVVDYGHRRRGGILTGKDELGIYHALRFHGRVRRINLDLPLSIFHKVLVLMDECFPILERLSLSFETENSISLTLPKAFLAPNLRHLSLSNIRPPQRLRLLTSTTLLVTLHLGNIRTSGYYRPRLLVARLQSLPLLEALSVKISTPISHPSTERELLGEQGAPVTLPNLKKLRFEGACAYLDSLVAQIRAPLLDQLHITLFNRIAFALPHLFHLINITEAFEPPKVAIFFYSYQLSVTMANPSMERSQSNRCTLDVMCGQLDWQIDLATQICHALIPKISGVEKFTLYCGYSAIPREWQNGVVDDTAWHELLRPFTGVKELLIYGGILEGLSRALRVDGVGSDPGFLPNLRSITAKRNLFTSFIDTRKVVGRPVEFSLQ